MRYLATVLVLLLSILSIRSLRNESLIPIAADVIIKDSSIYVEGKEYFIKGMAYRPFPLGIKSMTEEGCSGGGYCSPKINPYNEFKSACYDFDIFDGSPASPDRVPPGPTGQWFNEIWTRDFPKLKELGVNTIRIYNFNPITREIGNKLVEEQWNGVTTPYGKDHKKFMATASSFDLKVIVPLLTDYETFTNDTESITMRKIENIVREIGESSSLLMFEIGNEFDLQSNEEIETMNRLINYTRDRMLTFYNRQIPIMHCTKDDPARFLDLVNSIDIDVFCANAGYREDLDPLFEGIEVNNYEGWKTISQRTNVPFFIGELGLYGMNSEVLNENPTWFNYKWNQTVNHIDDGCVGASYFEYNDEPYTQANSLMKTLGVVYFQAAMNGIQLSTDRDAFWVDEVHSKSIIYDSLKNGVLNGIDINYNTDVFEYMQRDPKNITIYGNRDPESSSSLSFFSGEVLLIMILIHLIISM